jgi:Asp/Glu/hydantoin racemase
MRIWYQSFGDLSSLPSYRGSLEAHTARVASPGTEVVVRGVRPGTYGSGAVPPIAFTRYPYLKYLNQLQIVDNALLAEEEGFDAFAIGCYHDPALREARSVVRLPVLSIGEASMLVACSFARTFGVVTMCTEFADYTRQLASDYGLERRLAGIEVMAPALTEFDMEDPRRAAPAIEAGFEAAAHALRRAGAELVIPGDGNLNEALYALDVRHASGLPVMDAVGCLVKLAESYVGMRQQTGLETSRAGFYARAPEDQLYAVRRQYGLGGAVAHD